MTGIEVTRYLHGVPSWIDSFAMTRTLFITAMQDKQYGFEECRDAWHWFYAGWTAHVNTCYSEGFNEV